ncbi:MAG: acyl-CoA/acyl-ACP dehydrogenase [Saprospiraceae bacterium]|nr:acyl-CoA/acyl-ACP dehydrogenase [Saprospiraceae bacterium]
MNVVINEEQQMLKTSAKEFLKSKAPIEALRKLRDSNDPKGYDPTLWKEMAEMGWASLNIPEAYGGMNFGFVGFGQILEEMGRTLVASPIISTCLVGSSIINFGGSTMQKENFLPRIADGSILLSLASEESNAHKPLKVSTQYAKTDNGYSISGKKNFVIDGNIADYFIVTATDAEKNGISLFIVDAKSEGISVEKKIMMDSRNAAVVTFENVKATNADLIGEEGKGIKTLEKALDIGRIGLSAEMLGSMQEAFDRTIAYLKERKQFGVVIGTFQALQHRAAQMYCEIELCKSLVIKSLQAIDTDSPMLPYMASMTKSKIGEVLQLITNESIQLFGGIGMTDDEEIGFFMKRARVAQQTFGDYNYHLDRFARLSGF